MSNSVVKVTEAPVNDNLILIIGEDGTVVPDRKTVEAYLSSRSGETELQIMQVNKSDARSMDVTVDTVTYLPSHSKEASKTPEEMDKVARNLMRVRMDHDYTPFTSPKRESSEHEEEELTEIDDELAQTLSILEGSSKEQTQSSIQSTSKFQKIKRVVQFGSKSKVKPIQTNTAFKQPNKPNLTKPKIVKQRIMLSRESDEEYASDDEEYIEEMEDDGNDSDYEIDESRIKNKTLKKIGKGRVKLQDAAAEIHKQQLKTIKVVKTSPTKIEQIKVEKFPETVTDNRAQDKKVSPKKDKKIPKPIPDDFALFSTPDIIRRVGGKQEPSTPTTPNTPTTPKTVKIIQGTTTRTILDRSNSLDLNKDKRTISQSVVGDGKNRDRRYSLDLKRRQSIDTKTEVKERRASDASIPRSEGHVTVHSFDESTEANSNESLNEDMLEPVPSAEDIRAIIQNEDTKTFTTGLIIPDPAEQGTSEPNIDPNQMNLDSALELEQSILDNINSDLISEDILYQVAQSLVDNAEIQNAIDKSLVEENLVLDPAVQQAVANSSAISEEQPQDLMSEIPTSTSLSEEIKGTPIMRSDGRMVIIPPLERPATRSRNRKPTEEPIKSPSKSKNKVLDDEHISGGELDSSNEDDDDDKSDDDPDKLWCICNQPHNNRFMICCDICEEWYHGKCVNITKQMGKMMEEEGHDWICIFCKDSTQKRPEAAARRIRKAQRAAENLKKQVATSAESIATSSSASEVSPIHSPSTTVPGCLVCGKPCRANSIYCSDSCILKHAQGVEKKDEKVPVFERSSGKFLSGSSAPSATNLDKWLQQNPGFEVVRSSNNKPIITKPLAQTRLKIVKNVSNPGVSLAVQRKGVNVSILKHAPKPHMVIHHKSPSMKQQLPGVKIIKAPVSTSQQPRAKLIQPLIRSPTLVTTPKPIKLTPPLKQQPLTPKENKPMPQKTPKSRQSEDAASQPNGSIRDNVKKTLFEQLTNRLKMVDDIKLNKEEVTKISNEIESQLYKCFGDTGQKYRNKYRSLIFNIKDIKNQTLWRRICQKSINPYQLVRLSPDDLASQELALWRERENKHQLDMITKSELELLGRNRQFVFKTHKGEQVFEDPRPTDAVENTEVITNIPTEGGESSESASDHKRDSKEREKKKHSRSDRDRNHDRKTSKDRDKSDRKERKRDHRSTSRDRSRRKRSRSKESGRHSEKTRSRSRDKHRRSSHKSSKHRKDSHSSTDKLDKKSKEILEQLVDNKIVPPLEDRLWKHVQQEDVVTADLAAESDSDHEPTSTVTIPTPPRTEEPTTPSLPPAAVPQETHEEPVKEINIEPTTVQESPPAVTEDESKSPPPKSTAEFIWKGIINMVDVAQISIMAQEVSGDCIGLGEELPPCVDVVGRICPETVWEYIGKMKCSNSKSISLVRLNPLNLEEKMPYIALYSYLSSRNRLGVVKSVNKAVKDFYILPLASQTPIPQALLPLNGPGFEESRPALLLGIIVRDKRKRPLFSSSGGVSKKAKMDASVQPGRSYTPPPLDPRLKHSSKLPIQDSPKEELNDMDEPYSPEDSDPDSMPAPSTLKPTTFLDTNLPSQTFEPFSNKFDTIPGLDDATALPASSLELQRKMEELDQRIAMQKAEIHNMSQNIASTATSDIGTSALASIALPSNLQQILDSIKGINASSNEPETVQAPKVGASSDLTIPLMLPKLNSRNQIGIPTGVPPPTVASSTIPLNLPKYKNKYATSDDSPIAPDPPILKPNITSTKSDVDKSGSVLSSLSEEDLIRKAAEMLGETETLTKSTNKDSSFSTTTYNPTPVIGSLFNAGPGIFNTPPPTMVPAPPLIGNTALGAKLDANQPPIPGLDD